MADGRCPGVNLGSVIPFFFRHSRSAANRFAPPAGAFPAGAVVFEAALALVPVDEDELVEEPPPHLKFIFATTEPDKVIATIRSRTHHYPFRLMAPSVMRDLTE